MTKKRKVIIGAVAAPFVLLSLAVAVVWFTNPWLIKEGLLYADFFFRGDHCRGGIDASSVNTDGIDVSHHNGWIEWDKVAANKNIRFVYVKATQGVGYVDPMFRRNVKEARKVGLEVGVYHFFTRKRSGKEQFAFFKNTIRRKYVGTLVPMVDVEDSGVKGMGAANLRRELKVFCQLVEKEYGRKPIIYTNSGIYNNWLNGEFDDCCMWIARYGIKPHLKSKFKYQIWQFTEHGRVDGIRGFTDLNYLANGVGIESLKREIKD